MPREPDLSPADMVVVRDEFDRVLDRHDGSLTPDTVGEIIVALEDRGFSLVAPGTMKRLERRLIVYGITKDSIRHLADLLNAS